MVGSVSLRVCVERTSGEHRWFPATLLDALQGCWTAYARKCSKRGSARRMTKQA